MLSASPRNSFFSVALLASAALAALVLNGSPAVVHSVGWTATMLASFTEGWHPLAERYDANSVVGPNGKTIGAAFDPRIRSQWQREGLPE